MFETKNRNTMNLQITRDVFLSNDRFAKLAVILDAILNPGVMQGLSRQQTFDLKSYSSRQTVLYIHVVTNVVLCRSQTRIATLLIQPFLPNYRITSASLFE